MVGCCWFRSPKYEQVNIFKLNACKRTLVQMPDSIIRNAPEPIPSSNSVCARVVGNVNKAEWWMLYSAMVRCSAETNSRGRPHSRPRQTYPLLL